MPYQCLATCGSLIVAARDSSIDLFNDGAFISTWTCASTQAGKSKKPVPDESIQELKLENTKLSSAGIVDDVSPPPAKRRKHSTQEDEKKDVAMKEAKSEAAEEPNLEPKPVSTLNQQQNQQKPKKQKQSNRSGYVTSGLDDPAVTALAVTEDARHVVAITGEDKSIRVFEVIEQDGVSILKQLSQRVMPKRPSSLAITSDDSTIISADKFGDVYSLPLMPSDKPQTPAAAPDSRASSQAPQQYFKPSANEFTIHSERNRKALENQKRQANKASEKAIATFEHTLLLGHVSLLTDIKLAVLNGRNYIITADRDEHIRVSRGIPHAHIIEGFCLGHKEFVSRICVPRNRLDVLISGGGDDDLFVWNWDDGKPHSQTNLSKLVTEVVNGSVVNSFEIAKVVVSSVNHLNQAGVDFIIVTCEGISALFLFHLTNTNTLENPQTIKVPGNVLSITTDHHKNTSKIIVSIDNIHKPNSTTELRNTLADKPAPLLSFLLKDTLIPDEDLKFGNRDEESQGDNERLKNLLYSLENLRKRRNSEGGDEVEEE